MVFETIRVEHVYHPSCENWTQSMTNDHQWTKGYLVHSRFLRQCLAALNSIKQIGDLYTRDRKQQIDPQFRSFNSRACGSTKILNFEDQIHPCLQLTITSVAMAGTHLPWIYTTKKKV